MSVTPIFGEAEAPEARLDRIRENVANAVEMFGEEGNVRTSVDDLVFVQAEIARLKRENEELRADRLIGIGKCPECEAPFPDSELLSRIRAARDRLLAALREIEREAAQHEGTGPMRIIDIATNAIASSEGQPKGGE